MPKSTISSATNKSNTKLAVLKLAMSSKYQCYIQYTFTRASVVYYRNCLLKAEVLRTTVLRTAVLRTECLRTAGLRTAVLKAEVLRTTLLRTAVLRTAGLKRSFNFSRIEFKKIIGGESVKSKKVVGTSLETLDRKLLLRFKRDF